MQDKRVDTQTMPLITFVVAYYDLPVTMLRQCLDSMMALPLASSEREIIVVDDGSRESPVAELAEYMDSIVYVRQRNGGLSRARNRGMDMARGEYINFVDADDYLIPPAYGHCLGIVRRRRPDILMFGMTSNAEGGAVTAGRSTASQESGTEYLCHCNLHASACGYLFRKSILGNLRFTPDIVHEDEEFTPLLLLRAGSVCTTNVQAYFYRRRPHSITTETDRRRVVKRLNDSMQVIVRLSRTAATLPANERTALQRRVAQLTMDYIYNITADTRSHHYLQRKLGVLKQHGLFPLPDRNYTTKYRLFRLLMSSSAGVWLLTRVLPWTKRR